MPALRWSLDINPCKAGKPDAATGQYRIWKDPGQHFRVMHRSRRSETGAPSEWKDIGEADTLDRAKAIAQAHAEPEKIGQLVAEMRKLRRSIIADQNRLAELEWELVEAQEERANVKVA